jgi:membrane protease YdiL (CAAX protease family)
MRKDGSLYLGTGGFLSQERLDGHDKFILLIWILAGLLGAGVAYKYFFQAFPEASVQFQVPREAALAQAKKFASVQGAQLDGYQSSIVFDVDDTAKTYLEREVGLKEANQIMSHDIHIWYWQTRFFRPLHKEEFDVRVDPTGNIVGYSHVLDENFASARLERAAAQAIAETFLRDTLQKDPSRYDFLEGEANVTEHPNRRDWSFSWEERGFRAKDAPYRLNVTLAGDHVSGYQELLKIPEAWKLDYERLRSSNNLIEYIALIPYALLLGGCLQFIFALGRRGVLEWRGGLALGLFLTLLYFAMTMNQWPLERASYDTNTPYSSFFLNQVGEAVLISVISALLVVFAVVPGEPLYRLAQPAKLRLGASLRLSGIRTKEFFLANVIGICMAAAHIGYITVFYIVSRKLGAWAPQDLNYENVVSTSLPWLYPLAIGIYAATSEEFLFRLFAIPFLQRFTKSNFLAVVLPAFAWGFLHSNYPQEPAYIRGIEVGLIGIVAGLVMLRWGIWATLIWHYTVDAFLISTSLLRSSGAYLRFSGAIVGGAALIPLAVAAYFYFSRGGFETAATALNSAKPLVAPPENDVPNELHDPRPGAGLETHGYRPMSSTAMAALISCGIVGLALLIGVKREAIGDFVRFQIHASDAVTRANQVLLENKVEPSSYHHAATITYTFDPYTNEYLRRTIGISAANRLYRTQVPPAFWTIRYFRDSQNEEYMVVLQTDGSLHSLHHTLDEKKPGANLSNAEAQGRAETYLRDQKNLDLAAWNLVESHANQRPARIDHTFTWEQKAPIDPTQGQSGAHVRMQLQVLGDEVSSYRVFIKIPEEWRDAESRTTPLQLVQSYCRTIGIAIVFITVLVVFLRSLRRPEIAQIRWRGLGKFAVWMGAAAVVIFVNRAPQLLVNYTTAWPLKSFYAVLFISLIFAISLYLSAAVLLLGLAWFFLERVFGRGSIQTVWSRLRTEYYRDALLIAVFGASALAGLSRLPALFSHWPMLRHTLGAAVPDGLDTVIPAAGAVASAIAASFAIVGMAGLAAALVATYVRTLWMRIGLLILVAVLITNNVITPGSFLREAMFHLVALTALWFGITRIARFNVMGYLLLAAMIVALPGASEMLQQPSGYFHANGYAVILFAVGLLAAPLLLWRRGSGPHARG